MKAIIGRHYSGFLLCFVVLLLFVYYNDIEAQTVKNIIPITSEDFVKPIWHPDDVIINAGTLGRYRFSVDTTDLELPGNVKIRPELIKFLNDLQREFNTSMIIMTGYRPQEQNLYLWAKCLADNTKCVKALNEKELKSWDEWISASQQCTKNFPLCTKHQTGDAVDFYWKGLDFQNEKKRDLIVALLNEIGGLRKYTDEERERYSIARDDDNLLKIVAYMPGENVNIFNPQGLCYFHVEYQSSEIPPKPNVDMIGVKLSPQEELALTYKSGEYVLIKYEDFLYPARVAENSDVNALEVNIYIFCDEIRNKLGDKISKNLVHTRRTEPKDGWGKQKVMLEYISDGEWKPAMDVLEFEDYYVVPNQDGDPLTVSIKNVRFPIAKIH
jgi:hypothetical protein